MTDHGDSNQPKNGLFLKMMAKFERDRVKHRLKAAFRRNPRPAKVRIQDDDSKNSI